MPLIKGAELRFPNWTQFNTGGQAGGAIFPFLTGLILDTYSWDAVFLFLAASSFVALAVMLFVVEPIEEAAEVQSR
jgi:MFS family permease